MKNKPRLTRNFILLGGMISTLASPAFSTSDFSLVGGVGLEAHDNAALTHSNEQSDTKRAVNAEVGYKKTDGAVTADINYQAEYENYLHEVQSDQTAINGKTELMWQIAPRQLDAVLYHQISQQLTDRRGLDVPNNREERSILTAGLNGFLHLSPVDSLVLAPRFSAVRFQESDNSNSKRASMAATWDHKITKVSALDLTASYDDVKFDDSVNDYTAPGLMLSYHTVLSRLSYQIGFGGNRINRDTGKDFNGSSATLAINYKDDNGQDWGASYIRQLTDNSIGLAGTELQVTNFQSNDSNFGEIDYIQEDKLDLYWHDRLSTSSQLTLGTGYQKEDYKTTPRDQTLAYVQLGYLYTINSRWSAALDVRFDRTKFLDDPKLKYDTTRVYVSAIYHPSRPLEVRFSIGQDKRDADVAVASYTDNVALVGLRYHFF